MKHARMSPLWPLSTPLWATCSAPSSAHISPRRVARGALGALALSAALSCAAPSAHAQAEASAGPSAEAPQQGERIMDIAPLPKTRGFWGTFFFWSGGVLCMYLVGRRVFKEQSHERRTLKLLSDQIGPFFPEFDPPNLRRWMDLAAPHLYAGWRAADLSGLSDFSEPDFIEREQRKAEELIAEGRRRVAHLGAVLNIHPLGAYLIEGAELPPQGVELPLRVELKVIDYLEGEGGLVVGEQKTQQQQWLWVLRHNGASWRIHDVSPLDDDITDLSLKAPLPPIIKWERPEGVKVTTELSAPRVGPKSLPPLSVISEADDDTASS